MGFDPRRSVVVEDTPRAVQAGVAAGIVVLAYADNAAAAELAAAGGHVFTDMHGLPDRISQTLQQ